MTEVTLSIAEQLRAANGGKPVPLPESGVTVFIKPIHLPDLVAQGILPRALLAEALKGFPDLELDNDVVATDDKFADALLKVYQFETAVLKATLVNPKLVANDSNDPLGIKYSDLLPEDRNTLIGLAQLPVKQWETFLSGQRERVYVVPDSQEYQSETE